MSRLKSLMATSDAVASGPSAAASAGCSRALVMPCLRVVSSVPSLQGPRDSCNNFYRQNRIYRQTCRSTTTNEEWRKRMATRIIDISVALQSDIASDPPGNEPKITYIAHKASAPMVCAFFPGLTPDQ